MEKAEITNLKVWMTNFPSGHLEHVGDHGSVPSLEPVGDNVLDVGQHEGDVELRARDCRMNCIVVPT